MPEMTETIDADEVEQQLPAGWWAENDGDTCVYAYAGEKGATPAETPASATIEAVGNEMWNAQWNVLSDITGFHEPADDVTGAKERVVEWVAEKAAEVED